MPTLSEAAARMVTADDFFTNEPFMGLVIATAGASVSIGGGGGGGGGSAGSPFAAASASTRPCPYDESKPAVPRSRAVPVIRLAASAAVRPRDINNAPTPATCGAAMEVPLSER